MAASYFDVDGTLVSSSLVEPTLFYVLNQGNPLKVASGLFGALVNAPRMIMAEMVDRRTFNELLFAVFKGMSDDRIELLSKEVFDKVLKPKLYPLARDLVKRSKTGKRRVVLISGALEPVLKHVAEHLDADEIIGNRLEFKAGVCTGKLLSPVVAGPEKARIIREHARKNGFDLEDCHAFSDSYSDLPMLSIVGHPAAVNPDRRLELLARAYRWPSFDLRAAP